MTDTAFATDDFLKSKLAAWQRDLGAVRRLAPKTLEAYWRDLGQFLEFLSAHTGGTVTRPLPLRRSTPKTWSA